MHFTKNHLGKLFATFLSLLLISSVAHAQDNKDSVMTNLVALRTDYISRIKALGFQPALSPPEIIMDNPRSFGNFERDKNILHTCDWNTLGPQERQLFENFGKNIGGMSGKIF